MLFTVKVLALTRWGEALVLDPTTEMNLLYDFYGPLLKAKQRHLLEMYFVEDWSLREIAEHQGVSRQAVFESIKRAKAVLRGFEAKLRLLEKHQQRTRIVAELHAALTPHVEANAACVPLIQRLIELD
jgi:uncharacterized protein